MTCIFFLLIIVFIIKLLIIIIIITDLITYCFLLESIGDRVMTGTELQKQEQGACIDSLHYQAARKFLCT